MHYYSSIIGMNSDVNSYKGLYLKTSQERLQKILENIIVLEKNPGESEAVDAIHLDAHSLKGASKLMGYEQISTIAYLIETFFSTFKENKNSISPPDLNMIKDSVDCIVQSVQTLDESDKDVDLTSEIKKLDSLVNRSHH